MIGLWKNKILSTSYQQQKVVKMLATHRFKKLLTVSTLI